MNATCPTCQTVFRVDPAKVPPGGVRARCSVCRTVFPVSADGKQHTYSLPLGRAPAFMLSGKITQLRLDPLNAAGTIRLKYFIIIPAAKEENK